MNRHALLIATSLAVVLTSTCIQAQQIYWTDVGHGKIRRSNLNGSGIEELVTGGLQAPGVIAVDRTADKMYWTDWAAATARIQRANFDGTEIEDLVTGLGGPYGIALDTKAGKMYWTEFSAGAIRRANLDGTSVENLVTTGLSMPMEIELDLAARKMYWTDLGTDKIQRADLNGENVEDLVTTGFGTFVGLGLDLATGKMYFSDSGEAGSQLRRANLDGTMIMTIVATGIGACYGLTLDVEPPTAVLTTPSAALRLDPVFPNPFNPATVLSYRLGIDTGVLLQIFSLHGEHIATLVDAFKAAGDYHVTWNGRNDAGQPVPSGMYLCRIEAGPYQATQKMTLAR